MQNKYSTKIRLRTSDFDTYGKIKPSSVLDLFQEAAGAHANLLGSGFDDLIKRDLLWVVTKIKYEVLMPVPIHSEVVVTTWPKEPSRVTFEREYLVQDENGQTLIKASSQWAIMHKEKRTIVLVNDIYNLNEFCQDKNFEERFTKVPDFEGADSQKTVCPSFCELDRNGHVNNIRYADYVLNTIDLSAREITAFQIDYHREVKRDMPVVVSANDSGEEILAKGISKAGEKMFSCRILLK
ncbi:MAG: hypothetical protein E7539_02935 [Ruminococcaceae bacterium]|nr:hypothetical protein [Oscillospiraceae bacterium]